MKLKQKFSGFALIDVVVAIGLLGVALTIVGLVYPGTRIARLSQDNLIATGIAQKKLEELKSASFDDLLVQTNTAFGDPDLAKLKNSSANYTISLYDGDGDGVNDNDIKKITAQAAWTLNNESKNKTLTTLKTKTGILP